MSQALAEPRTGAGARRLTTVVAADICGYSRLAEIDDAAAVRTVNFVRAAFETVVARRRGRLFHTAGDGFLAEFPSASDGVLAALEFVADMKARDKLSPLNSGARVRAGVHAGDVIEQPNGDLLGHGVNIAARLQAEADPNGVLVSLAVVNHVRGAIDAQFIRRGALALKNIDEPVVAFDAEAGSPSANLGQQVFKRLRANRLYLIGGLAATLIAANASAVFYSMRSSIEYPTRIQTAPNISRSDRADTLIDRLEVNRRGNYVDPLRLEAAYDAILSLQNSDRADKAVTTVALIRKGDLSGAATALQRIYEEQTAAGLSATTRIETLSEIAAVIFHEDTTKAIARNLEILALAKDIETADRSRLALTHYALATLYHRVNDPEQANLQFALMKENAPKNGEVRIWAELGFLNSWMMKPRTGADELLTIKSRLDALSPSLQGAEMLRARAEYWTSVASIDYFLADVPDANGAVLQPIESQRRAVAIEERLAAPSGESSSLARALMRLGVFCLQVDLTDEGQRTLEKALAMSREINDRQTEGSILLNIAYAQNARGDHPAAKANAQTALSLASRDSRPNLKALSRHLLADISENAGAASEETCSLLSETVSDYAASPLADWSEAERARKAFSEKNCATI